MNIIPTKITTMPPSTATGNGNDTKSHAHLKNQIGENGKVRVSRNPRITMDGMPLFPPPS